jgi:hypothetical protein
MRLHKRLTGKSALKKTLFSQICGREMATILSIFEQMCMVAVSVSVWGVCSVLLEQILSVIVFRTLPAVSFGGADCDTLVV